MNGDMAVTIFFIISGFLMSLVLSHRYSSDLLAFYKNRALRIYPAYFVGLLLAFFVFLYFPNSHHNPAKVYSLLLTEEKFLTLLLVAISNVFIFGADILKNIYLFEFDASMTTFFYALPKGMIAGHNFYVLPQNWTLAVELTFYLVCPFLSKLSNIRFLLFTIIVFSICDIISTYNFSTKIPLNRDGVFFFSFRYFLLGMLAHKLVYPLCTVMHKRALQLLNIVSVILLLLISTFAYNLVDMRYLSEFQLYSIYAFLIPIIFNLTKDMKWDDKLGQYSYPIYIFHYPVAKSYHLWDNSELDIFLIVAFTILLSTLYLHFIEPLCKKLKTVV